MDRKVLHEAIGKFAKVSFVRSGGKGGQNVNKVNTKVHVTFALSALDGVSEKERALISEKLSHMINSNGEIFVDASDERFQERNRELALERLENKIVSACYIPKKRIKTKPTKASKEKRLKLKKLRSEIKRNREKLK